MTPRTSGVGVVEPRERGAIWGDYAGNTQGDRRLPASLSRLYLRQLGWPWWPTETPRSTNMTRRSAPTTTFSGVAKASEHIPSEPLPSASTTSTSLSRVYLTGSHRFLTDSYRFFPTFLGDFTFFSTLFVILSHVVILHDY